MGAGIDISSRTSAIVALIGLAWFLAEHRAGRPHTLPWVIAMLVAVALSLSRTALLAGFVITAVSFIAGSPRHRIRNVTFAVMLLVAGYWAITSWAPLHDRFFQGDVSLSVGGVNVNAEGRTKVWGVLWSEVPGGLLLGHGVDTASARSLSLDPAFDQPHNDYLRLVYDFGLVEEKALLVSCVVASTRCSTPARRRGVVTIPAACRTHGRRRGADRHGDGQPARLSIRHDPLGALVGVGIASALPRPSPHVEPRSTGRHEPRSRGGSEARSHRRRSAGPVCNQGIALARCAARSRGSTPREVRDPRSVGELHVTIDELVEQSPAQFPGHDRILTGDGRVPLRPTTPCDAPTGFLVDVRRGDELGERVRPAVGEQPAAGPVDERSGDPSRRVPRASAGLSPHSIRTTSMRPASRGPPPERVGREVPPVVTKAVLSVHPSRQQRQ